MLNKFVIATYRDFERRCEESDEITEKLGSNASYALNVTVRISPLDLFSLL